MTLGEGRYLQDQNEVDVEVKQETQQSIGLSSYSMAGHWIVNTLRGRQGHITTGQFFGYKTTGE